MISVAKTAFDRSRYWLATLSILSAVATTGTASAAVNYGVLNLTASKTLTKDQYGAVVFLADNITLDCAGKQVHISSYTPERNCPHGNDPEVPDAGGNRCGIIAVNKQNITVKNCHVVGGFTYGIYFEGTNTATITQGTTVAGAWLSGIYLAGTTATTVSYSDLNVNGTGVKIAAGVNTRITNVWAGGNAQNGFDEFSGTSGSIYKDDTYAYDNGDRGFSAAGSSGTTYGRFPGTFPQVNATGHSGTFGAGFSVVGSVGVSLMNASASGNTEGIQLFNADNGFIDDNQAIDNINCDVFCDPASTGNFWSGNFFGTTCGGNVPPSH